jgi:hypothetical protein
MSNKDHENQYLVTAGGKEEPYPKFKPDTWRHEGQRTWSDYFLGRPPGESFMFVDDQGNQHTHFVSGKDEGRRRTKRIGEVQNGGMTSDEIFQKSEIQKLRVANEQLQSDEIFLVSEIQKLRVANEQLQAEIRDVQRELVRFKMPLV